MIEDKIIQCFKCKTSQLVPFLTSPTKTVCLNCILLKSSLTHIATRYLINPIEYSTYTQRKIQTYFARLIPTASSTSSIGFCVIGQKFETIPKYWPTKSVNIEINGETFLNQQINSYYVSDSFLINQSGQRYIDFKISIQSETELQYILAIFQLEQISLPETIKSNKQFFLQKAQKFLAESGNHLIHDFSMRCPLTWNLIQIPVRFKECQHFQCFNYRVLSKITQNLTSSLKCPYCSIKVKLDNLIIDPFQYKIINAERSQIQSMDFANQRQNIYVYNISSPTHYFIGKQPN